MWRRQIIPLTDQERDNHLFRIPDDPIRYPVLPEVFPSPKLGDRCQSQPQMETKKLGDTQKSGPLVSGNNTLPESTVQVSTDATGMFTSPPTLPETQPPVPVAS